ncbi:MAG: hypothetical protein M1369_02115 [Deinococcus sp.]|nr:hypothetical protein [Deinococcus sp.]MCL5964568.1 hypothetical protein [Deinococcus sp.]
MTPLEPHLEVVWADLSLLVALSFLAESLRPYLEKPGSLPAGWLITDAHQLDN